MSKKLLHFFQRSFIIISIFAVIFGSTNVLPFFPVTHAATCPTGYVLAQDNVNCYKFDLSQTVHRWKLQGVGGFDRTFVEGGLASDPSGNIVAAYGRALGIEKFDPNGTRMWFVNGGPYFKPITDPNGNIYVLIDSDGIAKINPNGSFAWVRNVTNEFGGGVSQVLTEIGYSNGSLIISAKNTGTIWRLDPSNGNYLQKISGYDRPMGVEVDRAGNTYVSIFAQGVIKLAPNSLTPIWQSIPTNSPYAPGIAWLGGGVLDTDFAGDLYVGSDAGGARELLKLRGSDGAVLWRVLTPCGTSVACAGTPYDIRTDPTGNVWLASKQNPNDLFRYQGSDGANLAGGCINPYSCGTSTYSYPFSGAQYVHIEIDKNGSIFFANGVNQGLITKIPGNLVPLYSPPTCTGVRPVAPRTTNGVSGTYDIYVDGVQNANAVIFPTWTNANGQDDLPADWVTNSRFRGTNMGGGTWRYSLNLSQYPGIDTIRVHVYYLDTNNAFYPAGNLCGVADVVRTGGAPTGTISGPTSATVGSSVTFTANVSDADGNLGDGTGMVAQILIAPYNTTNYSVVSQVTTTNCTNRSNCIFTGGWIPPNSGQYTVVVNAFDSTAYRCSGNYLFGGFVMPPTPNQWTRCDRGGTNRDYYVITINAPPQGSVAGPTQGYVGQTLTFTGTATDQDNNINAVQILKAPAGTQTYTLIGTAATTTTCTTNGNTLGNCVFSVNWTPTQSDIGNYNIAINAFDSTSLKCSGNPLYGAYVPYSNALATNWVRCNARDNTKIDNFNLIVTTPPAWFVVEQSQAHSVSSRFSNVIATNPDNNRPQGNTTSFSDSIVTFGTDAFVDPNHKFFNQSGNGLSNISKFGNVIPKYNDISKSTSIVDQPQPVLDRISATTKKTVDLDAIGSLSSNGFSRVLSNVTIKLSEVADSLDGNVNLQKGVAYILDNASGKNITIIYDLTDTTTKTGILLYIKDAQNVMVTRTTASTLSPKSSILVITNSLVEVRSNHTEVNKFNMGIVTSNNINYRCYIPNTTNPSQSCRTEQLGLTFAKGAINLDYKNDTIAGQPDVFTNPTLKVKYNPLILINYKNIFASSSYTENFVGFDF